MGCQTKGRQPKTAAAPPSSPPQAVEKGSLAYEPEASSVPVWSPSIGPSTLGSLSHLHIDTHPVPALPERSEVNVLSVAKTVFVGRARAAMVCEVLGFKRGSPNADDNDSLTLPYRGMLVRCVADKRNARIICRCRFLRAYSLRSGQCGERERRDEKASHQDTSTGYVYGRMTLRSAL